MNQQTRLKAEDIAFSMTIIGTLLGVWALIMFVFYAIGSLLGGRLSQTALVSYLSMTVFAVCILAYAKHIKKGEPTLAFALLLLATGSLWFVTAQRLPFAILSILLLGGSVYGLNKMMNHGETAKEQETPNQAL